MNIGRYNVIIYDPKTHIKEINLPTGKKVVFEDVEGNEYEYEAQNVELTESEVNYIRDHFRVTTVEANAPM